MCGIAGFIDPRGINLHEASAIAKDMAAAIAHRGPDDDGTWVDPDAGIAMAHRRLSILDLSPAGHQPMRSHSGRYVIVYNGEIYNHGELKQELESCPGTPPAWVGYSDTEILLAGIEQWGVTATLSKLVGMFAFTLWDRKERRLFLARDRMGEKPLYYGWQGPTFLFASELKAMKRHKCFRRQIDRTSVALFLKYSYVPAPRSIYIGIRKLLPGHYVKLDFSGNGQTAGHIPDPIAYWSLADVIVAGRDRPFTGTESEASDQLQTLLADAVRHQMVSDVPVGAFLSGGVDSSLVTAIMQSVDSRSVRTFTVGFDEDGFNEAAHAEAVARYLGTAHMSLQVRSDDALGIIPNLSDLYDEPFADVSQIPMALIARLTRKQVTVALSGDGGDELFGGYNRHAAARYILPDIMRMPFPLRRAASDMLAFFPDWFIDSAGKVLGYAELAVKAGKFGAMLGACDAVEAYERMVATWRSPSELVVGIQALPEAHDLLASFSNLDDPAAYMMACDTNSYLPDDILVKVDRATMGAGLESRAPFLDHRLVEFAWRLPASMKFRDGKGKWLVRELLYRHVPAELVDRPKAGFAVPVQEWLRGSLRSWAQELLNPARLESSGFLQARPIIEEWRRHLAGSNRFTHQIWVVLMFQAWLAKETTN